MKNYFRGSSLEETLERTGLNPEEGGNKLLWKFGNYLSATKVSYPRSLNPHLQTQLSQFLSCFVFI
jgi:hypothetical protein